MTGSTAGIGYAIAEGAGAGGGGGWSSMAARKAAVQAAVAKKSSGPAPQADVSGVAADLGTAEGAVADDRRVSGCGGYWSTTWASSTQSRSARSATTSG